MLVAAGVLLALAGDRLLADDFAAYARELEAAAGKGTYLTAPSPGGPMAMVVGGALLLVAGLVVLAPAAIAGLATPAARMPLSMRLAMRDAARHRHRTGPATSAIAVAVAGSVVLAFLFVGNLRAEELRYVPSLPPHVLAVSNGETDARGLESATRQASAELPGATAHILREPLNPVPEGQSVPAASESYLRQMYLTPDDGACEQGCTSGTPAIAGSDALNEIAAGRALRATRARRAGGGHGARVRPGALPRREHPGRDLERRPRAEDRGPAGEARAARDALHQPAVRPDPAGRRPRARLGRRARARARSPTAPGRRPTRSTARAPPRSGSARRPTSRKGPTTARARSRC